MSARRNRHRWRLLTFSLLRFGNCYTIRIPKVSGGFRSLKATWVQSGFVRATGPTRRLPGDDNQVFVWSRFDPCMADIAAKRCHRWKRVVRR